MEGHGASFEVNRALWNARTRHHVGSKFYDVEGFLGGANSLGVHELDLLGDVRGKSLLHLQCHFGQDTLSLARMGALSTGLDFSNEAIAEARTLADRAGLHAEFVLANVLDPQPAFEDLFDIIFTSYGVLGWLPDLGPWARNIARWLRPGGRLVLVEFHPTVWMFNNEFTEVAYSYFNRERIVEVEQGTYADTAAPIALPAYTWNHALADPITALLQAGLRIDGFQELDGSPHDCFTNTVRGADGLYRIRGMEGKLPMVYSVVASREE
jgi:2-polyprenyl-3-methyl-5-hydroxy-6-metoxy-1,4-benzoquinol methylase